MTPAPRPGVLFDVDGTLLDTNYLQVLAWWRAFRDTGHDEVPMADCHRSIGIGSAELVTHLLGDDADDVDEVMAAVAAHGLDASRTVAVGDTVWDVRAARHAGLPCIALTCGGISRAELLEEGADEVYDDPADLLASLDDSLIGTVLRD
jgi:phosphoglycolate phosphatase-like HAD superfamily hydrolase